MEYSTAGKMKEPERHVLTHFFFIHPAEGYLQWVLPLWVLTHTAHHLLRTHAQVTV